MNNLLQQRKDILSKLKESETHDNLTKINREIVRFILNDPDVNPRVKEYHKIITYDKKEELIKTYNYFLNLYEYLKELQDTTEILDKLQMLECKIKEL